MKISKKLRNWLKWLLFSIPTIILTYEHVDFSNIVNRIVVLLPTGTTSMTDWIQALMAFFSLLSASLAAYVTWVFNKNSEIQNKISFESDRPKLRFIETEFLPGEKKTVIRNDGLTEAENVILFTWHTNEGEPGVFRRRTELCTTMAESEEKIIRINEDGEEYQSNLLVYTNRLSGIVYMKGYNLNTENSKSYSAIGENFNDGTASPLEKKDYLQLSQQFSVKNQIFSKKSPRITYSELEAAAESFALLQPRGIL